jgi:hypothetical protein
MSRLGAFRVQRIRHKQKQNPLWWDSNTKQQQQRKSQYYHGIQILNSFKDRAHVIHVRLDIGAALYFRGFGRSGIDVVGASETVSPASKYLQNPVLKQKSIVWNAYIMEDPTWREVLRQRRQQGWNGDMKDLPPPDEQQTELTVPPASSHNLDPKL